MNWIRGNLILVLTLVVSSYPNILFAAQAKIQGDYCYQYGDSESLMVAKEISYAMALRKAIETYKTFVASTSVVEDFKLRKDLVETIASGYVENVQIVKQDVKGRTVCTELAGYVNPDAVKSIIARKVGTVQRTKRTEFQGLLSNDKIKILNYKKTICGIHTEWPCVEIMFQAKRDISASSTWIIIDWYDRDGNQIEGNKTIVPAWDLYKGEVRRTWFELNNDKTVSFGLRLR
jgi:hypothetical protein